MKGPTKIVLGIGILLGAAVAGVTFEQVGRGRDRIRYPQVGQSFRLGERTVNMYCSGDGTPTVVFDSSAHTAGYRWVALQPQAAAFSRACWYDRAGYDGAMQAPLHVRSAPFRTISICFCRLPLSNRPTYLSARA
jgi:hypothetical protein